MARKEAERLRLGQPTEHWLNVECDRRAYRTADNYGGYLRKWIIARLGDSPLAEVKAKFLGKAKLPAQGDVPLRGTEAAESVAS
jgi:hypothetical protein